VTAVTHGARAFDPAAAARILNDRPRPSTTLPVAPWAAAYGFTAGRPGCTIAGPLEPGPGFDPARAMTADLSRPLIIATVPVIGALIIDGADRLYQAHRRGLGILPALVLTEAETRAITSPARTRP
jgi:hypothetical protein